MKIKIYILFFLTISFVLGCRKLNETIYDTPSVSNSVNTAADVSLVFAGAYGILEHLECYKKETVKMMELCADHMSSTTTEFAVFSQKIYDPSTGPIRSVYSRYYSVINNCNFLLEKLNSLKLDSTYTVRAEGEIKFVRAFVYFDLVRLFGPIPLRTSSVNINADFYVGRDSVTKIYNLIFEDLKTASNNLLPRDQAPIPGLGYTNKGAAQAMLSLAALTYGNFLERNGRAASSAYTMARDYADSVILSGKYSLANNYADLWDVDLENMAYATEVIFGLRFTRDKNASSSAAKGSEFASRMMPNSMPGVTGATATFNSSGNVSIPAGIGSSAFKVQPWFYDYCTTGDFTGDYRSEVTFLTQWQRYNSTTVFVTYPNVPGTGQLLEPNSATTLTPTRGEQPYVRKYVDGKGLDASNHENDLFIIRLAEVFLIRAEAENELNGPSGAYASFNMLRARARKANGTARLVPANLATGLTKDQFRKKIFDERGLEFIGECKRWFDLVRMKNPSGTGTMYQHQFQTFLPTIVPGIPVYNITTRRWAGGKTERSSIVPYNSKFLLFPIPQIERDLNAKLTQNGGYN